MVKLFPIILTGTFFSTLIFSCLFFPGDDLSNIKLWIVPVMALLTTLTMLVYYSKKEPSKKKMLFLMLLQAVLVLIIIFSTLIIMEWIDIRNIWHILVLSLLTLSVTGVVFLWMLRRDKKDTDVLNQKLREFQKGHSDKNK